MNVATLQLPGAHILSSIHTGYSQCDFSLYVPFTRELRSNKWASILVHCDCANDDNSSLT